MKSGFRNIATSALLAAAAVLGMAFTQSAAAQTIVGTPHDFSGAGWGSNQVCIFCHTPHNANITVLGAPLWNHAVSTATYTLYSSGTMNATLSQPGGVSKLCLSCHDGTVAIDSYGTRTGTNIMTGSELIGTALNNDHPIGFNYNAALVTADGGLRTPVSTSQVTAVNNEVPLYGGTGALECSSCHNVHSNAQGNFLRVSNAASALCLKCHIK